jgi:signal transduction histidine kinase
VHRRNARLFEIYVPIRHVPTGAIIAVAEFYKDAAELEAQLKDAKRDSWIVTGLVGLAMIAGLFSIVAKGSHTIEQQKSFLTKKIDMLSELLQQNRELRQRIVLASQRSTEIDEHHLRRLGSDLHDGPAQLVGLALLRLDEVFAATNAEAGDREAITSALGDALEEIRNISAGLALPEIERLSLTDALSLVVSEHEKRTKTQVSCTLSDLPLNLSHAVKLCFCRFVQEALYNSFRHAGGKGQSVMAKCRNNRIQVTVSDHGPGILRKALTGERPALGLAGLHNRLESVGGKLDVWSRPGAGTRLTAYLPISGVRT